MYKCSDYNILTDYDGSCLLYNSFKGTLAKIDSDCKADLESLNCSSRHADAFVKQGFWVDAGHDELGEIKELNRKAKFEQKEVHVTLKLTDECNFRCFYCYQAHAPNVLDSTKMDAVKKYLARICENGIESVRLNLFGGEPTLNLAVAIDLADYLKSKKIEHKFSMATNGYLLTPSAVADLERIGVSSVQVTLDGPEHVHDKMRYLADGGKTYGVILDNIAHILDATDIQVIIRHNLTKNNVRHIPELYEDLHRRGLFKSGRVTVYANEAIKHLTTRDSADDGSIYFDSREDYARENFRLLEMRLQYGFKVAPTKLMPSSCPFDILNNHVVGTNLDLEYCTSSGSDMSVGAINPDGSVTKTEHDLGRVSRNPFDKPKCAACKLLPVCMGGCALMERLGKSTCTFVKYVLDDYVRLMYVSRRKSQAGSEGGI